MMMGTHDLHFYEISIIHNILITIWNHSHQLFALLWSYLLIYQETLLNVYYWICFIYFYYVYINQGHINSIKLRLFIIFQYIFKLNQRWLKPVTVYFAFLSIPFIMAYHFQYILINLFLMHSILKNIVFHFIKSHSISYQSIHVNIFSWIYIIIISINWVITIKYMHFTCVCLFCVMFELIFLFWFVVCVIQNYQLQ